MMACDPRPRHDRLSVIIQSFSLGTRIQPGWLSDWTGKFWDDVFFGDEMENLFHELKFSIYEKKN